MTRDGFLACCGEEVAATSLDRQQIARRCFNRTLTPGRGFYHLFLSRWRQLTNDRAGSLEESRAQNALPDVVARWYAALKLSYCDPKIKHAWHVLNMGETHCEPRLLLVQARTTNLCGKGMHKSEVLISSVGSGAEVYIAAVPVFSGGLSARLFLVVEGKTKSHCFAKVPVDGKSTTVPLAARLNPSAIVGRRAPAGDGERMSDVWSAHFAAFATADCPKEAELLSLDEEK